MALVQLEEIQKYCKNKSIALVGNSSSILRKGKGKEIDSHDIVIRMNHGVHKMHRFYNDIGRITSIYDCEISVPSLVAQRISEANSHYITRLIRWGDLNTKLKEDVIIRTAHKIYFGCPLEHRKLKQTYFAEKVKPSTGTTVLNFLINHIDYKNIDLYGFDFFKFAKPERNKMNEFQSYLYKDHNSNYEEIFFRKMLEQHENIKHIN